MNFWQLAFSLKIKNKQKELFPHVSYKQYVAEIVLDSLLILYI